MVSILLAQPVLLEWLLSLMIVISLFFFAFKLRGFFFRGLAVSKALPLKKPLSTILIEGSPKSGKSLLFQKFIGTGSPFSMGGGVCQYGIMKMFGEPVQFIDVTKHVNDEELNHLDSHLNAIVFIFDVSKNSYPISTQIRLLTNLQDKFRDRPVLPIVNIKGKADEEKLQELKEKLSKDIPEVSLKRGEGVEKIRNVISYNFFGKPLS